LSNNAAGPDDGDWASHRLDLADCLGRGGPHQLSGAANNTTLTRCIAGAMEHADPSQEALVQTAAATG
jgi:hypothetical protein